MHESSSSPQRTRISAWTAAIVASALLIAVSLLAPVATDPAAGLSIREPFIGAAGVDDEDRAAEAREVQFTGAAAGVDVAEDGTRFAFDRNGPVLENGFPDYGNGFVTQGYIYPKGTLDDSNGVLAAGSPAYPDLVIGEWTCWGYFVGDGANTTDGAWVITTQVFDFDPDRPGTDTMVTVGMETPAGAGHIARAVTGGTGRLRVVRGEVVQETLGHNATDGVNATFDFDLDGLLRARSVPSARGLIR